MLWAHQLCGGAKTVMHSSGCSKVFSLLRVKPLKNSSIVRIYSQFRILNILLDALASLQSKKCILQNTLAFKTDAERRVEQHQMYLEWCGKLKAGPLRSTKE